MSDSRVVAVGDRRTVTRVAGARAERIDCGGATVLPGIVDPHLHLFGLAARDAHLDCAGFDDVAALLEAIRRRAEGLAPETWLRGEGLDESRLDRLPTAAELERAAPRNPVRLRHRSRHASVLSSSGLVRLPLDARGLDGLVAGREDVVGTAVGPLAAHEIAAGLARTSRELAACGITTVADATPRRWVALAPLRRAMGDGAFAQRVFAMRPWDGPTWRGRDRLQPGPVKIMVEETPAGLVPSPVEIGRRIRVAVARGAQVAVHCVGAATLVAVLDAFAALPARARRGRRHRLEHVAECPPPLVARIAALDLTVVTNPAFVYWRGDVYRRETDGAAQAWLYRAQSLIAAGVPVAAASDAPVVPPDPWLGIAAAREPSHARWPRPRAARARRCGGRVGLRDERRRPRAARRSARAPRPRDAGRSDRGVARSRAGAGGRGARDVGAAHHDRREDRVARVRPFATVRFETRGAVAVVTLDRPESLNAYNVAMRDDLFAVLGAIDADPGLRVMILRGAGRAFSTGGDLREFGSAPSPVIARAVRFQRDVWGRLLTLRAVTLAAVHGHAVGGGMEMMLLCDLCVAASDARLALPETGLGMIPGVGGTQTLPRAVGMGRALELVLTGRTLDAREAHAMGLVYRVVAPSRLDATAMALARRVAGLDPALVQALRRCVRAAHDAPLDAGGRA